MIDRHTIDIDDLHGYVDGQLSEADEQRIEAWLSEHPDDAAAVHAYRLQNARLHETYDHVLDEPVPAKLEAVVRVPTPALMPGRAPWQRIAASLVLVLAGGLGGWFLNDWQQRAGEDVNTAFVGQAVGAHQIFVRERRHAVEVPSSDEAHLVRWLSKRLGTKLRAPSLTSLGYDLVGGRLLAEGALPVAQFMYENNKKVRLTVYVRAAAGTEDTSFRYVSEDIGKGDSAFYWIDRNFAYALVAPLAREKLMPIANKVYEAQQSAE